MKITAAVTREKSGPFTIEQVDLDEPRANEVMVRLVGAGVCHRDLTARDQNYPFPLPGVLGHEGAGVVEKVGSNVRKVQEGDRVILSYGSCGRCDNCLIGQPFYCEKAYESNFSGMREDGSTTLSKNGERIHGAFFNQSSFATYALGLAQKQLHRIGA
jgi:aryl-alcohol dehydrogenase